MNKITKNGEYYLYALSVVGLDRCGFNGKITYIYQIMEKIKYR